MDVPKQAIRFYVLIIETLSLKSMLFLSSFFSSDPKKQYMTSLEDLGTYGNLSYTIIQKKLTWFEALRECQKTGAHLASVHDSTHNRHLEQISTVDGFPLWIGLSRQQVHPGRGIPI